MITTEADGALATLQFHARQAVTPDHPHETNSEEDAVTGDRPGTELVLADSVLPAVAKVQAQDEERPTRPAPSPGFLVDAVSQLKNLLAWYDGDSEMRYRDTVEDGSHDNGRRAGFAALAVLAYAVRTGSLSDRNDEDPATVIGDLLCDLRHLADSLHLDFAELARRGGFHYVPELHGEF